MEMAGKPLHAQYIVNVHVHCLVGKGKITKSSWDPVLPFEHVKDYAECLFQAFQIKQWLKCALSL